jgi:hypothetical protein
MRLVSAFVTGFMTILLVAVTLFFTILFKPARAAPQCDGYDRVATLLADTYGEALTGQGIAGGGAILQLFAHPEGDTWSIVVVLPDGQACLMASGKSWETMAATPAGEET